MNKFTTNKFATNKLATYLIFSLAILFGFSEACANPLAGYAVNRKSASGVERIPGALIEFRDAATDLPATVKVKTGTPIKDRTDAFYAASIGDVGRWAADVKPGRYIVTVSAKDSKAEAYSLSLNALLATCSPSPTNGYLNITDCGGTQAGGDDDTQAIKDAIDALTSVGGGKLYFPRGIYDVGTTSAGIALLPINLTFGITIEGTNGGAADSVSSCRISLGGRTKGVDAGLTNKAIFRISNNVRHITIRDIVLETTKAIPGSTGILAEGDYPISAFDMLFSNMSIKGFDVGFDVKPCTAPYRDANGVCRDLINGQPTGGYRVPWQFDQVKADHVSFTYNKIGVRMDTGNTDWNFSSCWFYMLTDNVAEPTTAGLFIQRGGFIELNNTFGGGVSGVGGNFIYAANLEGGALQIINSQVENVVNSIVWGRDPNVISPPQDEGTLVARIVVTGSEFGAPIKLRHRVNFISTGNHYGPNTIVSSTPLVRIYSMGDKFCQDGYFGSYPCPNPGFQGPGTVVFSTGQSEEGSIGGGSYNPELPNRFGLPVEINGAGNNSRPLLKVASNSVDKVEIIGSGTSPLIKATSDNSSAPNLLRLGASAAYYDFKRSVNNGFLEVNGSQGIPYRGFRLNGVLQLDPDITYADLVSYGTTVFNGLPVISDGAFVYCKNCEANSSTGVCQQAASGGGAFAKRVNGAWKCN